MQRAKADLLSAFARFVVIEHKVGYVASNSASITSSPPPLRLTSAS
jgi:hypothetical protein